MLPITCNLNPRLQQFTGIFITISTPGPFGQGHWVKHCNEPLPLALLQHGPSMDHSPSGVYLLRHGLIHSRGVRAPMWPYPWTTIPSGVYLFQRGPPHGHSPFRGVPAVMWTYPRPQTLQGLPPLAWTYPRSQTLRGVLLLCGLIHRSQSL